MPIDHLIRRLVRLNANPTREEKMAISRIGGKRVALWLLLFLLVLVLAAIAGILVESFGSGSSNPPEWLVIPVILGCAVLGGLISLIVYMAGSLRDREKAGFVRTSLSSLKAASVISDGMETSIFRRIADSLLVKNPFDVVRGQLADGWPHKRAQMYTGLVESLISRCEWNINCEAEAADFRAMLAKMRWSDSEMNALTVPVIEIIREHGGRRAVKKVAGSILKNVVGMIIILILAPTMGWLLFSDSGLDLSTKYDFVEALVWMVPGFIGLVLNIASIIRKLNRG